MLPTLKENTTFSPTHTNQPLTKLNYLALVLVTILLLIQTWNSKAQEFVGSSANDPAQHQTILVVKGRLATELPAFNVSAIMSVGSTDDQCPAQCNNMKLMINQSTHLYSSQGARIGLNQLKPNQTYELQSFKTDSAQSILIEEIRLK